MTLINKLRPVVLNGRLFKYSGSKYKNLDESSRRTTSTTATTSSRLRVVFFGSDFLSLRILAVLKRLVDERRIGEISVVTSIKTSALKDDQERVNLVVDMCSKQKIPYHLWSNISKPDDYMKLFRGFHVGVLASFGHLIPTKLIDLFPHGIINVHPSLLPKWRGASPVVYSILFDDKIVGVSIMKILPKHFDIGPLISQRSIELRGDEKYTTYELLNLLGNLGGEMIGEIFEDFQSNVTRSINQSNENISYAHKINPQMFYVNWKEQTCREIDCQYRALHEIKPLKTVLNGNTVKLLDMADITKSIVTTVESLVPPGTLGYLKADNVITVKCKDGFVGFKTIMLRKKLSAKDFYNGYLNNRGSIQFESVENNIKKNIYQQKV